MTDIEHIGRDALSAVQKKIIDLLRGDAVLMAQISGLYDGPPARAAFPYIAMQASASANWSHKSGTGRELRLALAIYDDVDQVQRLHRLMGQVEALLETPLGDGEYWAVIVQQFLRSRILRDADAPWTALIELRVNVLQK